METIGWIKDIIYLIPLLLIIWKAATQNAQIKRNTDDINELKKTVRDQNEEILKSLSRLNDSINSIRCDMEVLKALRKKELGEVANEIKN
jgi:hypothetical protein